MTGCISTTYRMEPPATASECFNRLDRVYREWRGGLRDGNHTLEVQMPISNRLSSYESTLRDVCGLWNAAPISTEFPGTRLNVWLTYRGKNWLGCSTAVDTSSPESEQGPLRLIVWADTLRASRARDRASMNEERAKRRANPVRNPVEVPKNIARDLARYLRLEFGESPRSTKSVKASNLEFVGEFVVDGVPTQYWSFPNSAPPRVWAIVERFDDHIGLATTTRRPPRTGRRES